MVQTFTELEPRAGACGAVEHKAAQKLTAYKNTTGAGMFNVKGRCLDASLFPLSLNLRNPAGLLLISLAALSLCAHRLRNVAEHHRIPH